MPPFHWLATQVVTPPAAGERGAPKKNSQVPRPVQGPPAPPGAFVQCTEVSPVQRWLFWSLPEASSATTSSMNASSLFRSATRSAYVSQSSGPTVLGLSGYLVSSLPMQLVKPSIHLVASGWGPPAFDALPNSPRIQLLYFRTQATLPNWHFPGEPPTG